jgi:hypothetical protein
VADFVRVDPSSVQRYADEADSAFAAIRTTLEQLVDDVVTVDYTGGHSREFKTQTGQMAVDYAADLNRDIQQIVASVNAAIDAIRFSLGDYAQVQLSVNATPVAMPSVPQSDGSVQVNVPALRQVAPTVSGHFNTISSHLDSQLASLTATDWEGDQKDGAVASVTNFTAGAQDALAQTNTKMTSYIENQVDAILKADQAG